MKITTNENDINHILQTFP